MDWPVSQTEFRLLPILDRKLTLKQAYLFTSDVTRALRVSASLEAGSVYVNGPFMLTVNTPFGGFKESGNGGRESGKAGLMSYLEPKAVLIK
jgi:aldehyde dehydrogenase (NAD+)